MAVPAEIVVCPPELRADGIALVLRELTPEQQVAMVAALAEPDGKSLGPFDALFIATGEQQLVAAVWAQPQPGRTATLWLPQFAGEFDHQLANELVAIATRRTGQSETAMLQAILEPAHSAAIPMLLDAEFIHVADLIYLQWSVPTDFHATSSDLQFEPYHEKLRERLKTVLRQSYVGSLDCPQLDNLRTLDDTLAGYQSTGHFDPTLWKLVVNGKQDVGTLLLSAIPQTTQLELIYMGVVPEVRGRGFGAALLAHAQTMAVDRGVNKIVLAVDAANTPARQLYHRAGFERWSRRAVYVQSFSASQ